MTCSFVSCENLIKSKGLCRAHYQQKLRGSDLSPLRKKYARGAGSQCSLDSCSAEAFLNGYCKKHYMIDKRYSIHPSWYEDKIIEQNGACAICKKNSNSLHVDHDHESGMVRALLCGSCNRGLGLFHDDSDILINAYNYIRAHKP